MNDSVSFQEAFRRSELDRLHLERRVAALELALSLRSTVQEVGTNGVQLSLDQALKVVQAVGCSDRPQILPPSMCDETLGYQVVGSAGLARVASIAVRAKEIQARYAMTAARGEREALRNDLAQIALDLAAVWAW